MRLSNINLRYFTSSDEGITLLLNVTGGQLELRICIEKKNKKIKNIVATCLQYDVNF